MQISNNFKNIKQWKRDLQMVHNEKALEAGGLALTACISAAKVIYENCPLCRAPLLHTEQFMKIPMVFGIFSAGS